VGSGNDSNVVSTTTSTTSNNEGSGGSNSSPAHHVSNFSTTSQLTSTSMISENRLINLDEEAKLVYGVIYSLRNFVKKLTGSQDGFLSYRTSTYKLHYYETPTGLKFVINTDTNADSLRPVLRQIYVNFYVEYVVKNPLSPAEHPHGEGVNNEYFKAAVDKFIKIDMDDGVNGSGQGHIIPEIDLYLHLMVMIYLLDKKDFEKGIQLSNETRLKIQKLNRRTLDQLSARIYFYYARFYELTGNLGEIRPVLLAAHRTATLRHDDDTQATLLNLLLRNYFHYNLYDQADKLVTKTTFPESSANNQQARYMYYLGLIKAIQLDYTASHTHLLQAIRKAPQNYTTAGFQQTVYKLSIIVQLLMGEIPERALFRQPVLKKPLVPYLKLVQAVRIGDLSKFQEALAKYAEVFRKDKNYTLILRLRHNVIKTGIRMISLSYSRISLRDICFKLHLDSEEDAEYIVAKAIRDGVIDATLDHEKGFMKSKENADIYSTNEPQIAFHQRTSFCLNLHNESVK
ncbi:12271_t:CDS:10, partial [Entrophospora sp. SA101]